MHYHCKKSSKSLDVNKLFSVNFQEHAKCTSTVINIFKSNNGIKMLSTVSYIFTGILNAQAFNYAGKQRQFTRFLSPSFI